MQQQQPSSQVMVVPMPAKKKSTLQDALLAVQKDAEEVDLKLAADVDIGAPIQVRVNPRLLKTLRQVWLQVCILQDTTVGRDKCMRLFQYIGRFLNGVTGVETFANLTASIALARKMTRFARPLKWARDMELCWLYTKDKLDRATTLMELGSYFVYCIVDHFCFAQRIGVIPWGPGKSDRRTDLLDRFAEVFWLTEVLPVFVREIRAYLTGGGAEPQSEAWRERRQVATLRLVKAACDFPCSIYCMWSFARRDMRFHKVWVGFLGAIASLISLYTLWPQEKCLTD